MDKAIKGAKSAGELNSEFIYEVRGPGRVAILVECLTKKRTYMPIALIPVTRKVGATQESGLLNMFEKKGIILAAQKQGSSFDDAETDGIEVGAEEVAWAGEEEEGLLEFTTGPSDLAKVQAEMEKLGYSVQEASITYIPTTTMEVAGVEAGALQKLFTLLEGVDMVTGVHHNAV